MFTAKYRGYDMNLYRSQRRRWLAGVCGGIAENMGWSVTGVRVATFLLFWFTGPLMLFAYIAAIFLIANERYANNVIVEDEQATSCKYKLKRAKAWTDTATKNAKTFGDSVQKQWKEHQQSRATEEPNLKDRVMYKGDMTSAKVEQIRQRLRQVDRQVRDMEQHVTSYKFQFDRELNR